MLHELIDREDPKCLYCNSDLSLRMDGTSAGSLTYDVETLSCSKCLEKFQIFSTALHSNTEYTSFLFSCIDICVSDEYSSNELYIGDLRLMWPSVTSKYISVPKFRIDFSDKKHLYLKLKKYFVIS